MSAAYDMDTTDPSLFRDMAAVSVAHSVVHILERGGFSN